MSKIKSSPATTAFETEAAVMFIDVDGFSKIIAKKNPEAVFRDLRRCLSRMSAIIQAEGGTVGKALGNGLICYFTDKTPPSGKQEKLLGFIESALRSAISIQREWAAEFVQGDSSHHGERHPDWHAFPMRIGINAGRVMFGNLGLEKDSTDFTVVGETVNLAKRLEGSADVFKILVSPSAKALLDESETPLDFGVGAVWGRRFMQFKYQSGLFEAWECNPFGVDTELLKAAMRTVRTGNKRTTMRVPWLCHVPLSAVTRDGQTSRVVDFSESGLCLEFSNAFARKEQLNITLLADRADWDTILHSKGLANFNCEVRWMEPVGQKNWHGVAFTSFTREQARALSELLIQFNNRAAEEA
jgi:class 3 adenylate cyclase